jgi:hypothetical protein
LGKQKYLGNKNAWAIAFLSFISILFLHKHQIEKFAFFIILPNFALELDGFGLLAC